MIVFDFRREFVLVSLDVDGSGKAFAEKIMSAHPDWVFTTFGKDLESRGGCNDDNFLKRFPYWPE